MEKKTTISRRRSNRKREDVLNTATIIIRGSGDINIKDRTSQLTWMLDNRPEFKVIVNNDKSVSLTHFDSKIMYRILCYDYRYGFIKIRNDSANTNVIYCDNLDDFKSFIRTEHNIELCNTTC